MFQTAIAPPTASIVTLGGQPRGANARVTAVNADSDDASRLKALGVCVGRRLHVLRAGDPMIIRVVGARVGLSARLAAGVQIEMAAVGGDGGLDPGAAQHS